MKLDRIKSYFFIALPFLFFSISILIPMITGIYSSFTNWNGINSPYESEWNGIQNFKDAFKINDSTFSNSIFFTFKLAFSLIIFINIFAITMAYLVTRKFKGSMFFRGVFFVPNLIGGLVVGYIWEFIFRSVFKELNFGSTWLTDANTGFWGIVIVSVWQSAGYMMILYIAAIQNIPKDIVEASTIDGASPIKKIFKIYLPFLMPAVTIVTFLSIRYAFGMFDQVFALTGGGPKYQTQTIAVNIYNIMFSFKWGAFQRVGQAQGVIYFLIVSSIALVQINITKRGEING